MDAYRFEKQEFSNSPVFTAELALPPEKDLFVKILKEKKRFTPYLVSGLKKKIRRIFGALS